MVCGQVSGFVVVHKGMLDPSHDLQHFSLGLEHQGPLLPRNKLQSWPLEKIFQNVKIFEEQKIFPTSSDRRGRADQVATGAKSSPGSCFSISTSNWNRLSPLGPQVSWSADCWGNRMNFNRDKVDIINQIQVLLLQGESHKFYICIALSICSAIYDV